MNYEPYSKPEINLKETKYKDLTEPQKKLIDKLDKENVDKNATTEPTKEQEEDLKKYSRFPKDTEEDEVEIIW